MASGKSLLDPGVAEEQLTFPCSCGYNDELTEKKTKLCGWVGYPVSSCSAHATTSSTAVDILLMMELQYKSDAGCRMNHCGTTGCKSDHSQTTLVTKNHSKPTDCSTSATLTTTRYQKRPTGYQTKPNQSIQLPPPPAAVSLSTNCKSLPKHSHRSSLYYKNPVIPFKMELIHTNRRCRGLKPSLAHLEHYLTSFTYPKLDTRLYQSLSSGGLCSDCDGALLWSGGRVEEGDVLGRRKEEGGGGGRRNEGGVRPSIVRVLVGNPTPSSSSSKPPCHISTLQIKSERPEDTFVCPDLTHYPLQSFPCKISSSRHPPSSHPLPPPPPTTPSSLSKQTNNNNKPGVNKNNNKPNNNKRRSFLHRELKFSKQYDDDQTSNKGGGGKTHEIRIDNRRAKKEFSTPLRSTTLPRSIYTLGVHLTQYSFPPLVISSDSPSLSSSHKRPSHSTTDTSSTSTPTTATIANRPAARTKEKERASLSHNRQRSSRRSITNSLDSLSSLVVSASCLWDPHADSHTTTSTDEEHRASRYSDGRGKTDGGRTTKISTKTLSPFRAPFETGAAETGKMYSLHSHEVQAVMTPNKLNRGYQPMVDKNDILLSYRYRKTSGFRKRHGGQKPRQQEDDDDHLDLLFLTGKRAGRKESFSERGCVEEEEESKSLCHETSGRHTMPSIIN